MPIQMPDKKPSKLPMIGQITGAVLGGPAGAQIGGQIGSIAQSKHKSADIIELGKGQAISAGLGQLGGKGNGAPAPSASPFTQSPAETAMSIGPQQEPAAGGFLPNYGPQPVGSQQGAMQRRFTTLKGAGVI